MTSPWLFCRTPRPEAALRLFCFPFAGGSASAFRLWHEGLPGVEVCPVQLPGRESRLKEPLLTRMPELVAAVAEGLGPWLDRPFAFAGVSMGGLVAYELTRHLTAQGGPTPRLLAVAASRAPQLQGGAEKIAHLDDAAFLQAVGRYNGLSPALLQEPELRDLFVPIMRADFAVLDHYAHAPGPELPCPVAAFAGTDDPIVSVDEVAAWEAVSGRGFSLTRAAGGHFFVQTDRPAFLQALSTGLAPAVVAG